MSLLEVRGLEAFYGGSQALFGVDFASPRANWSR
jgi:ABC-type branched-subunit amino acid transport system ATPase component